MKKYTSDDVIQAYYEDKNFINQSSLKVLRQGIASYLSYLQEEPKESQYLKIGSAVDALLTSNNFQDKYVVVEENHNLSTTEIDITKRIYDLIFNQAIFYKATNNSDLSEYSEAILYVIDELVWQKNWKTETRISKIIEKCSGYFEMLVHTSGKIILTSEEYDLINNCVNRMNALLDSKEIFQDSTNKEILYQYPIYFEFEGLKCKSLLDMLIVHYDHENKTIDIYPFDFKTTSSSMFNFENSFWKYGYDFQSSFYKLAILKGLIPQLEQDFVHYDIHLHDVEFLVVSTTTEESAMIFQYKSTLKEVSNLLHDLNWHIDNDVWNIDKEFYLSNYYYEIKDER